MLYRVEIIQMVILIVADVYPCYCSIICFKNITGSFFKWENTQKKISTLLFWLRKFADFVMLPHLQKNNNFLVLQCLFQPNFCVILFYTCVPFIWPWFFLFLSGTHFCYFSLNLNLAIFVRQNTFILLKFSSILNVWNWLFMIYSRLCIGQSLTGLKYRLTVLNIFLMENDLDYFQGNFLYQYRHPQ